MPQPPKQQAAPDFIPAETPDFIPAEEPQPAPQLPRAEMGPAPTGVLPWIQDAENDLRHGGGRTILGRVMGHLQGNGDKGYSGLESGVSPGQADAMGSVPLGVAKLAKGIAEVPQHPVKGAIDAGSGALQAASLPMAFMGGPIAEAGIEAVPSRAYAAHVLQDVSQAAKDVPVNPQNAWPEIERFQELTKRGGATSKPLTQISTRLQNMVRMPDKGALNFPEARDFYTNISGQSAEDVTRLNPVMRRQMGSVRAGLHQDLTNAADQVGRGEDYAKAVNEYSQAMKLRKAMINTAKWGVGPAVGAGVASELARKLIPRR